MTEHNGLSEKKTNVSTGTLSFTTNYIHQSLSLYLTGNTILPWAKEQERGKNNRN